MLKRATGAKEATERAEIEEALKLAYIDLVGEDVLNHKNEVTLRSAVEKVKQQGYDDKIVIASGGSTSYKLSSSSIILGSSAPNNTAQITVEEDTTADSGSSYYAVITGKYYEIKDNNNGDIKIATTASDVDLSGSGSSSSAISLQDSNVTFGTANVATATASGSTITLTASGTGTSTITVNVNGKNVTGNVEVVSSLTEANLDGAMIPDGITTYNYTEDQISSSDESIAQVTTEGIIKCGTKTGTTTVKIGDKVYKITSSARIAPSRGTGAPTVPAGFTAIDTADAKWKNNENNDKADVDKGLVIMDAKGNEFIWVPVPNAIHDGTTPLPETATTATSSLYTPMATTYQYNGNTYYRGMLYTHSSATLDGNAVTQVKYNSTWAPGSTNNREPSLVTNNIYDTWAPMTGVRGTSSDYDVGHYADAGSFSTVMEFGAKMQGDYDKMVQSVNTKGGFYIGRYESSLVNGKTRVVAGATSMNASQSTSSMWYGLYKKQESFATDNGLDSVESDMIWGSQYDAMMNWMAKNGVDVTTASGSRADNKTRNTSRKTGSQVKDKINNIYDILGNSREWTAEAFNADYRVDWGGGYNYSGSPSSHSYSRPNDTNASYGSRPTLYVQ